MAPIKKPSTVRLALLVCAAVAALVCAGCSHREPPAVVKKKLDIIAASDLNALAGELPKTSLRDSVFSRVVEYEIYKTGMYGARATVDFFYLRGIHFKRTVKYRYLVNAGKWERYDNEYRFYADSQAR